MRNPKGSVRDPRGWDATDSPRLHVVDGGDSWSPSSPGGGLARESIRRAAGHPTVIGCADGYPVEVRTWRRRPPAVADAVRLETGLWVSVRVLGRRRSEQ